MRGALVTVLIATAGPAFAGTVCNFNVECYMTEPCAGSGWELTADLDAGVLATVYGDLEVLEVADGEALQIVARGAGSLNLLTVGPEISLFTTHVAGEPAAITYVGECREE